METYIKAANVLKTELTNEGYKVEVGVNRFTNTLSVKVNEYGEDSVEDHVPSDQFELINEDEDTFTFRLNHDEEEFEDFVEENYDLSEFEKS